MSCDFHLFSFPRPWAGVWRQGFPVPVVGPSSPARVGMVHVGDGEGRVFLGPCSPVPDTPLGFKSTETSLGKQPLARGRREGGCLCMKRDGRFYFPCPSWSGEALLEPRPLSGLHSVSHLWVLTVPPDHSGLVVFISKLFKNSLPECGQAPLPLPKVTL